MGGERSTAGTTENSGRCSRTLRLRIHVNQRLGFRDGEKMKIFAGVKGKS